MPISKINKFQMTISSEALFYRFIKVVANFRFYNWQCIYNMETKKMFSINLSFKAKSKKLTYVMCSQLWVTNKGGHKMPLDLQYAFVSFTV
jgi:hypothetical protein